MRYLQLDGLPNGETIVDLAIEEDYVLLTSRSGDEYLIPSIELALESAREMLDTLGVEYIGARITLAKAMLRLAPHMLWCDFTAPGQGAEVIIEVNQTELCLERHELWVLEYVQAPAIVRMRLSNLINMLFPEQNEEA